MNTTPSLVTFTPSAIDKISEIIAEENNPNTHLRIFVQGGGCSGFQYGFTLDDVKTEDDLTFVLSPTVTALVDNMSINYLMGASVEYHEDLTGAKFNISNPQASSTCGCGSSFSMG